MTLIAKKTVHYTHPALLSPTNAITVTVIGAGGTGSAVMTGLAKIHVALRALHHPGLFVRLWDDDEVSTANLGRQLFAQSEVGLPKSVVLINRLNLFFGTNWKAVDQRFDKKTLIRLTDARYNDIVKPTEVSTNLFISCVDTVKARFEIAEIIQHCSKSTINQLNRPYYWLDLGNSKTTGQGILATVGNHTQPTLTHETAVNSLPFITAEFADLLTQSEDTDDTPSCSQAEALAKQDLFINPMIANLGCALIWSLFKEGKLENRGFFLNLGDLTSRPLKINSVA